MKYKRYIYYNDTISNVVLKIKKAKSPIIVKPENDYCYIIGIKEKSNTILLEVLDINSCNIFNFHLVPDTSRIGNLGCIFIYDL